MQAGYVNEATAENIGRLRDDRWKYHGFYPADMWCETSRMIIFAFDMEGPSWRTRYVSAMRVTRPPEALRHYKL
jgi:hypothetical protein